MQKFILLSALFLILTACRVSDSDQKLIITSIFPLKDLITQIAGPEFRVKALIQPGESPHTYNPTPQDAMLLEKAALFLKIGYPGMEIEDNLMKFIPPGKTKIFSVTNGLKTIPRQNLSYNEKNQVNDLLPINSHVWLSPVNAQQIILNIKNILSSTYPDSKELFEKNYFSYKTQLENLDKELKTLFQQLTHRSFVEFHPAWGYLARDYQLIIAGTVQKHAGHEENASLKELQELMENSKKLGARAIFIEPQFNPDLAKKIATELGLGIAILDPLGGTPDKNSYLKLIHVNALNIYKALQ